MLTTGEKTKSVSEYRESVVEEESVAIILTGTEFGSSRCGYTGR